MGVLLILIAFVALYMLPSWVAVARGHRQLAAIVALNLLLGWTLLGWIGALVWSLVVSSTPVVRDPDQARSWRN